ncbi:hypothetical protein CDD81_3588 [Ophiocordyceps australis]|uniref:Uncharacterized protein n=1 Tax=Ophiocordyceps australis TaxID=1399860 RepID=A0A2C5YDK4_9HYPO|nr:hypothetical protein CDD81_3588 [Ophiocordyceps australis]
MSLAPLQRERAESIPQPRSASPLLDRQTHSDMPYRASPSSCSSSSRPNSQDDDCCTSGPGSEQPQLQDDDAEMLAVPRVGSSNSCASSSSCEDKIVVPPALPARSALRTSRLLASLAQKPAQDDHPMLPHAAPHQIYLSSEEDASSSADDLSDIDEADSTAAKTHRSSDSSASREDTARVVTVVFHGRPSIVDLPRKPAMSSSSHGHRPSTSMMRTATEPTLGRPRSMSTSSNSAFQHPPRSSSMMPGDFARKRPQFLTIDPFAAKLPETDAAQQEAARTPKTPTAMFRKTLNLVRKRSRPLLNQTSAGYSRESLSSNSPVEHDDDPISFRQSSPAPPPASKGAVSYQSIMKSARRNAASVVAGDISPLSTRSQTEAASPPSTQRSRFRSRLSISQPRSIVRA